MTCASSCLCRNGIEKEKMGFLLDLAFFFLALFVDAVFV
jgi:hypothetical protein